MNKKLLRNLTGIMAVIFVMGMAGCSVKSTTTNTTTTVDADGNTVTTTTTTSKDNGRVTESTETTEETGENAESTEEYYTAELHIVNESGVDFYEMYCASNDDESWGDEVLGENSPLCDGERLNCHEFKYSDDYMVWDFMFVDENDGELSFEAVDFEAASDPYDITLTIECDEDDVFNIIVE